MTRLVRMAGRRTFASLRRHRNYRLFFAGQITSVCGTWMQNVALYWLILSLTHSPLAVGFLSLARFGPFTILGLFSGVVADRFDNRRTVIVTQSVQMVFSGAARGGRAARDRAGVGGLRDRRVHRDRRRLRPARPPEPHRPARRPRRAAERDRAQLLAVQHGPHPRPGARRHRDRRGRLRLVLRDQQRRASSPSSPGCSRCGSASSTR